MGQSAKPYWLDQKYLSFVTHRICANLSNLNHLLLTPTHSKSCQHELSNAEYRQAPRTSASMASIAATTVLNTAELCEMIFMELDFNDLLHIRQVNHYFRAVIEGSKSLKCKLFLSEDGSKDQEDFRPNPLLGCLLEHCEFKKRYTVHKKDKALVALNMHHVYDWHRIHSKKQIPELFANMVAVRGHSKIVIVAYAGPTGNSNGSIRTRYKIEVNNTLGDVEEGLRKACHALDEAHRSGYRPPDDREIRTIGPSSHA